MPDDPNTTTNTSSDNSQKESDDKTALRLYLGRAEVRFGTMQRLGGAFIGGAGLLVIFPLFMKETVTRLADVFNPNFLFTVLPLLEGREVLVAALVIGPFLIALCIPVYALWLLVSELVKFFFSANIPHQPNVPHPFHPRLALMGLPFSNDDGSGTKEAIRDKQFPCPPPAETTTLQSYVLAGDMRETEWLDELLKNDTPNVTNPINVALPKSEFVKCPGNDAAPANAKLRMAFGLAGNYDRTLVEEAAVLELSLIRHNLILRRLVMRYVKALILFIWTAMVLIVATAPLAPAQQYIIAISQEAESRLFYVGMPQTPPAARDTSADAADDLAGSQWPPFFDFQMKRPLPVVQVAPPNSWPRFVAAPHDTVRWIAVCLLFWSSLAPWLVRRPLAWIYTDYKKGVNKHTRDPHLKEFEIWVARFCASASAASILLVYLEMWGLSRPIVIGLSAFSAIVHVYVFYDIRGARK